MVDLSLSNISGESDKLPDPIYAEPGRMGVDVIAALAERQQTMRNDPRRMCQLKRASFLKSQHKPYVQDRITRLYKSDLKQEISNHISTAVNPAADIVSSVCQVYRHGAIRRIHGASPEEEKAFFELVKETGIAALAPSWNDSAYFVGPQFVMPKISRERMRLIPLEQHYVDVVQDAEDPYGDPVAVAYAVGDPSSGANLCVLDGWSWRYFEVKNGRTRQTDEVVHALGDMPATALRFMPVTDPMDWHVYRMHERMVDGSIDVARVYATMQFVRRTQHHYMFVALGNTDAIARGQNLGDPEKPLVARTSINEQASQMRVEALPFDTDPVNFMKEMRFTIEAMAESTGVPVTVTTVSGSNAKHDLTYDENALAELRTAQTWWAQEFERRLWTWTVAMAKSMRHRLASDLPDPKDIGERFILELAPMHRSFADPKVEHEVWDWNFSRGMASFLDLARNRYPQLSDEELDKKIEENLEINGKWFDAVTSRNQAVDAEDGKILTAAEANGAMGPKVRDGEEPPPDDA